MDTVAAISYMDVLLPLTPASEFLNVSIGKKYHTCVIMQHIPKVVII